MDDLSRAFAALSDPTRRAILERLLGGEASVTELAEPFQMSMPAVSRHLKVLETARLISRGRQAQWRPCRLEGARLHEISDWVEAYRGLWSESPDRLQRLADETDRKAASASGRRKLKGADQDLKKDKKKKEKKRDGKGKKK